MIEFHGLAPVPESCVQHALVSARTEGINVSLEDLQQTALKYGPMIHAHIEGVAWPKSAKVRKPKPSL